MADPSETTGGAVERTPLLPRVLHRLRPVRHLPVWLRYAMTTVVVVAFFVLQRLLGQEVARDPFLLFFPAIIIVSFAFDHGSGCYATVLSAALGTQFAGGGRPPASLVGIAVFLVVGLFCATVVEGLRRTIDVLVDSEERLRLDVQRRRAAERALADSEERFRTTFEVAGVGVAIVDLDGRWLRVNRRLAGLLGYTETELLTRTFQDITHPDDLQADLEHLDRLRAGKIASYSMEKRYRRKDGSPVWILLTVAAVRDAGNAVQYYISVVQDIEDRRAAEAVLSRDRAELGRLVEQRTAALMRATEEQRRAAEALRQGEKLQAVGQLTGGIAHDFNNLLQVVLGGAELLRSPRLSEARRPAVLDGMVQAAKNARELTGRLLAFARPQPLRPEAFDLNERLRGTVASLRQTLGPRIELAVSLSDGPCPVCVDPTQLEVAVLNLAVNARDAMPGGGTLTLRTGVAPVAADGGGMVDGVELEIRDDGPGMPPAVLARVFEPFFTTKKPGEGTGLGLAQVRGFAKQSGGDVAIESAPGQGTGILLRLPRATLAGAAGGDAPTPGADDVVELIQRAAGRTVLVVDDNEEVADFACAMLHELGYATCRAADGAAALERLAASSGPVDAVFADVVMPGMNGLELATTVRARHPGVALLLASGYGDALETWQGERPAEVLDKPYQLVELGTALERSFRRLHEGAAQRPADGR